MMGSFLKYLDKMNEDFNIQEEKENYIDEIDESNVVCEEEDEIYEVPKKKKVIVEKPLPKSNNVYKKRLINELNELGLNRNKINEIVYNIFSDDVYEDEGEYVYEEEQYQRPQRRPARRQQSSFREKMNQRKQLPPKQQSMSEHASEILDGVPGGSDGYTPSIVPSVPMMPTNQYMMPPQQHYMPPQPQYAPPPPPPPVGGMMEVNNGAGGEVGPVMASAPQPMLRMPEGFENFKPDGEMKVSIGEAVNILGEPKGEHVGNGVAMAPQPQYMMPTPPPPAQQVNPQQAQAILEEPKGEHIGGNNVAGMGSPSDMTNHASQLL